MSKNSAKAATSDRKMAALVTCHKCKKTVNAKSTIHCSECENKFEFECGGLPEKVYRLMELESKKKWRCKFCIQKSKDMIPKRDASNITMRKKLTSPKLNESMESIRFSTPASEISQMDDSHILTVLNTSCDSPLLLSRSVDITLSGTNSVQEMKETISMLTSQLASTQVELESTILENNDLHRQMNKLTKENELLKTLCQRPLPEIKTYMNTTKKNRRCSAQFPDIKRALFSSPRPQSLTKTYPKPEEHAVFHSLHSRITELRQKLHKAEEEISHLTIKLSSPLSDQPKPGVSRQTSGPDLQRQTSKILILGTQQSVNLSSALIRSRYFTKYNKYQIQSQIKPHALCSEVLKNYENINLEKNDKLVICVGENDYDLNILSSHLRKLSNKFINNSILVLNIFRSHYINVDDLNNNIQTICNEYKNCHYVESNSNKLFDICKSLNFKIDCIDYDSKYLDIKELKKLILHKKTIYEPKSQGKGMLKTKGTIPYYFKCYQKNCSTVAGNTSMNISKADDQNQFFRYKQQS